MLNINYYTLCYNIHKIVYLSKPTGVFFMYKHIFNPVTNHTVIYIELC